MVNPVFSLARSIARLLAQRLHGPRALRFASTGSARRAAVLAMGLAILLGVAGDSARAQSGGSMGGGSWGSSSSSSGGGSSRSYGSSSSSSSSSSWSSGSSSGGGNLGAGGGVIIILGVAIFFIASAARALQDKSPTNPLSMGMDNTSAWGRAEADVTVLRFALDARVRKFVQAELLRIGKSANTATAEGRALMLREVALLLRRCRDAWVYGGAINEAMTDMGGAKQQFDRHVSDARGRFMHEVVRNAQGVITTADAPATLTSSADGAGLVVVTVVIAARTELFSVRSIGTGDDLRQALESASNHAAHDLIAIEIIWMPAAENEAISSIAVEAKYPHPDLVKLKGAMVGKTICEYCAGPYPAELVSCPHCGGRAAA